MGRLRRPRRGLRLGNFRVSAVLILACSVLLTAALLAVPAVYLRRASGGVSDDRQFETSARRAISAIARGDARAFAGYVSRDGVLVVRRRVDWKAGGKLTDEPRAGGTDTDNVYLHLGREQAEVWEETEVYFDRTELGGKVLGSILGQFQGFIKATRKDYRGEVYSRSMTDPWKSRPLVAAVEGKLCSNAYWYVYLRQEGENWRVYRMELAVH